MYELRLERRPSKSLRGLPEPGRFRIVSALDEMQRDPFSGNVKALRGEWKGFFRRRVGDYRILYGVDTDIRVISIESVSQRKDAY